jgi:hypothetical protein
MGGSVSDRQLDAIVAAYEAVDTACGRQQESDPIQPMRLPTLCERHALFSNVAWMLHAPKYDLLRDKLLRNLNDHVSALAPRASCFEMLVHAELTLCALFGVPQAEVQPQIDRYKAHIDNHAGDSAFCFNVPVAKPITRPAGSVPRAGFDVLHIRSGVSLTQQGKIKFDLVDKAQMMQSYRPLGWVADTELSEYACAICSQFYLFTVKPEQAPEGLRPCPWIHFMVAVNVGSTLFPCVSESFPYLPPYLLSEDEFLRHPAGRCFHHNYMTGDERQTGKD